MKNISSLFLTLIAISNVEAAQTSKFKSMKCLAPAPNILFLDFCRVRAYSRNSSMLNFGFTLKRPVNKPFFVSYRRKLKLLFKQNIPDEGSGLL